MRLFIAYVTDMYVPFDHTIHCDDDDSAFSFRMRQGPGEVAEITIERVQSGWAIMNPATPKYLIVSESETHLAEDAVVIARGRIVALPGNLFGKTQTIQVICGPANLTDVANEVDGTVDGPLMAFARSQLSASPGTCLYLDDADKDKPETYLFGRAADYYIDPATHEISIVSIVEGDVVHDFADLHFHDDETGPPTEIDETPVTRARASIKAPWTQELSGECDIAGAIQYATRLDGTRVRTLSPDFLEHASADFPNGVGDMIRGAGWKLNEKKSRVNVRAYPSRDTKTGRMIQTVYGRTMNGSALSDVTYRHEEGVRYVEYGFRFNDVVMEFEVSQERDETVFCVLTQSIQATPSVETEIDLGEFGTVDLTSDLTAIPYEPGEKHAGDRVAAGGRVFVCNEDHFSFYFNQPKPDGIPAGAWLGPKELAPSWHPYWDEVETTAPLRPWASEFITTDIGAEILAHVMLRMKKALLLRNRSLIVHLTYPWQIARAVTLKDSLRILAPWHDGTSRIMQGKILDIERDLENEAGPVITVTMGVSMGTGESAVSENGLGGAWNEDGYLPVGYIEDHSAVSGVEDIEFVVDADPVVRPVNLDRLVSWLYAVEKISIKNTAEEQLSRGFIAGVVHHRDPGIEIQKYPTRMEITMRPLATDGVLTREIYVAGELLTSPRGIDIVDGAAP